MYCRGSLFFLELFVHGQLVHFTSIVLCFVKQKIERTFHVSPIIHACGMRMVVFVLWAYGSYRAPRACNGQVSTGYGRGSKKLGVPTANLPESQFAENLRSLPTGELRKRISWLVDRALRHRGQDAVQILEGESLSNISSGGRLDRVQKDPVGKRQGLWEIPWTVCSRVAWESGIGGATKVFINHLRVQKVNIMVTAVCFVDM